MNGKICRVLADLGRPALTGLLLVFDRLFSRPAPEKIPLGAIKTRDLLPRFNVPAIPLLKCQPAGLPARDINIRG